MLPKRNNMEVIIYLTIGIAVIILFSVLAFFWGMWIGVKYALKDDDVSVTSKESLYCFECEIEMPVKEKDGSLYCSNCGLHH